MGDEAKNDNNMFSGGANLNDFGGPAAYDPNSVASLQAAKTGLLARYGLTDIESQDDLCFITAPGDLERLFYLQDLLNKAKKVEAETTPELRLQEIGQRLSQIGQDDDPPEEEKAEICMLLAEQEQLEEILKNPLSEFGDSNSPIKRPDTRLTPKATKWVKVNIQVGKRG